MLKLRGIVERRFSAATMNALLECPDFQATVREDIQREVKELLLLTNQCRGAKDKLMRQAIEESRREAVILLCGSGESVYNCDFIGHYERMILALECALELAESSPDYAHA